MAVTARAGNLIFVGLEQANIEKLKAGQPFHHHMNELGQPFQLCIFYGETMDDLKAAMQELSGPDTQIIDNTNRKKS